MTRTIEVCRNEEWLGVYGPLADLGHESRYQDEAGDEWTNEVIRRLEAELDNIAAVCPRGERMTCHGWNGANTFSRKSNGLGTFDDLTDEEWNQAESIAAEVAAKLVEEYTGLEITEDVAGLSEAIGDDDADSAQYFWKRLTDYHGLTEDDERIVGFASNFRKMRDADRFAKVLSMVVGQL